MWKRLKKQKEAGIGPFKKDIAVLTKGWPFWM